MEVDIFTTQDLSISYHGIDIIKNGLIHKHIDYREISFVEIKKGKIIKNWFVVTILGIAISLLFLWLIINNTPKNIPATGIGRGVLLIYISFYIFFFFGLTLIIISNIKSVVLRIILKNKVKLKYSLNQLKKKNQLSSLINFLKNRIKIINSIPTEN